MSYTPGTWESGARIHSTGREAYRKPKTPRLFELLNCYDHSYASCNGCGAYQTTGSLQKASGGLCPACKARAEAKPVKSASFGGVPFEGAIGYTVTKPALKPETEPQECDGWKRSGGMWLLIDIRVAHQDEWYAWKGYTIV